MIPFILRDRVAYSAGNLHICFQRTGLTKTASISSFQPPAQFAVQPKEGGGFALSGFNREIESFRLEKDALNALSRITKVLAADPDGKWTARRRYTMLAAGAFLALAAGASLLNSSSPATHATAQPTAYPAVTAGYAPAQPPMPPQYAAAPAPTTGSATGSASPPTRRAIHFGRSDAPPEKTLYVFSDPQCPHCRDLERTLAGLPSDYGIYVFATPFLPGAESVAARIHCSSDPKKAWREAMAGETVKGTETCDKASWGKENVAFFRQVGLTATPTIVAGVDGRMRTGAVDLPTLVEWMKVK